MLLTFPIFFTLHLLPFTLNSEACNLLTSNNAYIDTESESAINSMCARDPSELSLWEQYQCEYIVNIDGWKKCWPQRRMSTCAPGSLSGVLFIYHGFSACPGEYNQIAPKLQDKCWNIYQILTVGHGYNYCNDNDTSCIASRYNLSVLPSSREAYIDFVERMVTVITDEVAIIKSCELSANSAFDADALQVVISGLSFGAPLAAATVAYSGNDSIFSKQIVMSPFFGITYSGFDNLIYKCLLNVEIFTECLPLYFKAAGFETDEDGANALSEMIVSALSEMVDINLLDSSFETFNLMIRKALEFIIEHRDLITNEAAAATINDTLELTFGWGEQCRIDADQRDRGGFCKFKIKHLLAVHSFAMFVRNGLLMKNLVEVDTSTQMLMVLIERDGPTRNSLCAQYMNLYYNNADIMRERATNCMWMIDAKCEADSYNASIDNTCGVPHASLSEPSNLGIPPFELYWEETYHNGLIAWLTDKDTFGDNFIVKKQWDFSRDQCVFLDLKNPPKSLVADVPSLFTIGIHLIGGKLTDQVKNSVLDAMAQMSGVSRGVLELTYGVVAAVSMRDDEDDEDYVEVVMSLDSNAANTMKTILELTNITEIANYSVAFVEMNGEKYYNKEEEKVDKNKGKKKNKAIVWIVVAVILCVLVIVLLYVKYRSDQKMVQETNKHEAKTDEMERYSLMDDKEEVNQP